MPSLTRKKPKGDQVPQSTRLAVFERSGYACEMCGAARGDADPYSPGAKVRVTVGYISRGLKGGLSKPENLRALCNNCSDGLAGISIPPRPTRMELLTLVRRATVENQKHVLFRLRARFRNHVQA